MTGGMWMTSCAGSEHGGFWEILRKSVSCVLRSEEEGWLSLTVALWRVPHVMWGEDGKVIIERLGISLPYVETFNSKVINFFVPELRSRYVFFVFRNSYVLCIYVMNILCTFPIFTYGYVTSHSSLKIVKHLKLNGLIVSIIQICLSI